MNDALRKVSNELRHGCERRDDRPIGRELPERQEFERLVRQGKRATVLRRHDGQVPKRGPLRRPVERRRSACYVPPGDAEVHTEKIPFVGAVRATGPHQLPRNQRIAREDLNGAERGAAQVLQSPERLLERGRRGLSVQHPAEAAEQGDPLLFR